VEPFVARPSRVLGGIAASCLLLVTGCSAGTSSDAGGAGDREAPSGAAEAAPESAATVSSNVRPGARQAQLGRPLTLQVDDGSFERVRVTTGKGAPLRGSLDADKVTWTSDDLLQQGTRYRVTSRAVDGDGVATTYRSSFRTRALTLDQQTYPSFVGDGATVGVGMPAIVRFDIPVSDKESIQERLKVTMTPAQPGAWHWISDSEVHWRPKSYWKPGTQVTVDADVAGVPAGNGIFGQVDRRVGFTVGDAMVSKVDMTTHEMKVFRNGELVRTIPITTGEQPKFTTRSGTKVIMEKFASRRMSSETTGIPVDSADGYDIDDVRYAMRLTYSGEFIHAAPWSVADQGSANVSHGCTGMSTENAGWLYANSKIGDVVEYVGSDRPMTLDNGYGDWNMSFRDWKQASSA
jgi:lipoprotein-anchoring transpeptidase ErfK/SrfK